MDNNINFSDLWTRQTSAVPNQEKLFLEVKKMKQQNLRKLIIQNCLLIAISIFIILVWFYYQPQMITTKIGIILIILSMAIYLLVYNKSYALLKNEINFKSNKEYLHHLLALKAKQQFMHSTMLNLYFVLLSTGIGLYMYEYTSRMTQFYGVITYGITALWILFNWFYLRPKQIKKQQNKLDGIINKFENINKQLE